jgi:hypothetical protein
MQQRHNSLSFSETWRSSDAAVLMRAYFLSGAMYALEYPSGRALCVLLQLLTL